LDVLGDTYTLTTDSNGYYSQPVPAGNVTVDIIDSTVPPTFFRTAGEDPTFLFVPPGGTASDLDGFCPPCPPETLTVTDITPDDEQCSIDYDDLPITVLKQFKDPDCIKFEVTQSWINNNIVDVDPAQALFMNFTDCDAGVTSCQKREWVPYYSSSGPFRARCEDGSAIVKVFLLDEDNLALDDTAVIPQDDCLPPVVPGRKCGWTFEIDCTCPNPNCYDTGETCTDAGDCCSEICTNGVCEPFLIKNGF